MKRTILVALVLLSSLLLPGPAFAQDDESPAPAGDGPRAIPENRISFTVHGSARAPADQVEVELVVEASGEDGESAEKKQGDKLKAVQRALEKLKASLQGKTVADDKPGKKKKQADDDDDDEAPRPRKGAPAAEEPKDETPDPVTFTVELREGRSSIGIARSGANEAPGQAGATGSVTLATCVIVKMKGIADIPRPRLRKRLARILDVAIDAGADSGADGVGSRPAFRFRAKDNEELRALAHEDALKKARGRAKRLASLAGCELGRLKALAETGWMLRAGNTEQVGFDGVIGKIGNNKLNNYEMTTSTTEIELECQLAVEYELGKETEEPAPSAKVEKK